MTPRKRATTPTARQAQIASKAIDLAEKMIDKGTASSQIVNHFINIGSPLYELKMREQELTNELLEEKIRAVRTSADIEGLYLKAIEAMKNYSGASEE